MSAFYPLLPPFQTLQFYKIPLKTKMIGASSESNTLFNWECFQMDLGDASTESLGLYPKITKVGLQYAYNFHLKKKRMGYPHLVCGKGRQTDPLYLKGSFFFSLQKKKLLFYFFGLHQFQWLKSVLFKKLKDFTATRDPKFSLYFKISRKKIERNKPLVDGRFCVLLFKMRKGSPQIPEVPVGLPSKVNLFRLLQALKGMKYPCFRDWNLHPMGKAPVILPLQLGVLPKSLEDFHSPHEPSCA